MFAPQQVTADPRQWRPVKKLKITKAEALVLLGLAEPVTLPGMPWIIGYRYTTVSAAPHSFCALTAATSYAAAAATTGEYLTYKQKQELERLKAWRP